MTTPDVPHRIELTFELAAPPEQVWEAIATGAGLTSWFLPTEIEEPRGRPDRDLHGRERARRRGHRLGPAPPPGVRRARLGRARRPRPRAPRHPAGHRVPGGGAFRRHQRAAGVSSAFGTGADWEQEFFDGMEEGWLPFFAHLELYLRDFAGQEATAEAARTVGTTAAPPGRPMVADLGPLEVGRAVTVRGLEGHVHRATDTHLLVRVADPCPGFVALWAGDLREGRAFAQAHVYLFSPDAASYADQEGKGWQAWLDALPLPDPRPTDEFRVTTRSYTPDAPPAAQLAKEIT